MVYTPGTGNQAQQQQVRQQQNQQKPPAQPPPQQRPPPVNPITSLSQSSGALKAPPASGQYYDVSVGGTTYYFSTQANAQNFVNAVNNYNANRNGIPPASYLTTEDFYRFGNMEQNQQINNYLAGLPQEKSGVTSLPSYTQFNGSTTATKSGYQVQIHGANGKTETVYFPTETDLLNYIGTAGQYLYQLQNPETGVTQYYTSASAAQAALKQFYPARYITNYNYRTMENGIPATPPSQAAPNYSLKNPLAAGSVWGGLTTLGGDVQNFFAGSAQGYANLAGEIQSNANAQSNPAARLGGTLLAGLGYTASGFEQSFAITVGKPAGIPLNFATFTGGLLGVGTQVGLTAGIGSGLGIATVGGVLKGAAIGAGLNPLLTEVFTGGKATPGELLQSAEFGASIGSISTVGFGAVSRVISEISPTVSNFLQSGGAKGIIGRALFGGSLNVGFTLPFTQTPQNLLTSFALGAGLSPALELGGKYFDVNIEEANIQKEGYGFKGITAKIFGQDFTLLGRGTQEGESFYSLGTPEFNAPDIYGGRANTIESSLDVRLQSNALGENPAEESVFNAGVKFSGNLRTVKLQAPDELNFSLQGKTPEENLALKQAITAEDFASNVEQFYGSSSVQAQTEGLGTAAKFTIVPHDIDILFKDSVSREEAIRLSQGLADQMNESVGFEKYSVDVSEANPKVVYENEFGDLKHLVDIHLREPPSVSQESSPPSGEEMKLGFKSLPSTEIQGLETRTLGQTLVDKVARSLTPVGEGEDFKFSPGRRGKDVRGAIQIARVLNEVDSRIGTTLRLRASSEPDIKTFEDYFINSGVLKGPVSTSEEVKVPFTIETNPSELTDEISSNPLIGGAAGNTYSKAQSEEEEAYDYSAGSPKIGLSSEIMGAPASPNIFSSVPYDLNTRAPITSALVGSSAFGTIPRVPPLNGEVLFSPQGPDTASPSPTPFTNVATIPQTPIPVTPTKLLTAPPGEVDIIPTPVEESSPGIISPIDYYVHMPTPSPNPIPTPEETPYSVGLGGGGYFFSASPPPSNFRRYIDNDVVSIVSSPGKKKKKKNKPQLFELDVFKAVGGGIEEFEIIGALNAFYPATKEKKLEPRLPKSPNEYYRALKGLSGIGGFEALEARGIGFYPSTKRKKK